MLGQSDMVSVDHQHLHKIGAVSGRKSLRWRAPSDHIVVGLKLTGVEDVSERKWYMRFIALCPEMSHVTRKPVFGVSDQVRLNLDCSAIETS